MNNNIIIIIWRADLKRDLLEERNLWNEYLLEEKNLWKEDILEEDLLEEDLLEVDNDLSTYDRVVKASPDIFLDTDKGPELYRKLIDKFTEEDGTLKSPLKKTDIKYPVNVNLGHYGLSVQYLNDLIRDSLP